MSLKFVFNPMTAEFNVTQVASGGSGGGDVNGPGLSTDRAIARWGGTTGTVLEDSPGTLVQDSGAVQVEAIIVDRVVTNSISIPSNYTMIAPNLEIDTGEILIEADGELLIV